MSRKSPDLPFKIRFLIAIHSFVVDASLRLDGSVNRRLMKLVDHKVGPSPSKPVRGVTTSDITVDPSRNIWFRLFTPSKAATSLPVIVYFHGGGFSFLAPNSKPYDQFCRNLAREIPAIVISVNYRLSPEHRFPCQYDDGFEALKSIDKHEINDKFPANADLSRCFIAGDSAGGNLAHHVALRAGEYEFKEVKVIGLIAIQPFFGGEERTESEKWLVGVPLVSVKLTDWFWKSFLPDGSDRDHQVVNVFGPKSVDISGVSFPSTLLIVGGFDPLQDWQKRYYDGLRRSGKEVNLVEYPNVIHGFYGFPELPETALLIKDVTDFVQKYVSK